MKTILKLQEVIDVLTKKTNEGREYVRATFDVIDENEHHIRAKLSMSEAQWQDLKQAMNVSFNSEIEEIKTKTPITVEFDKDGKTKSKNPKPLMEKKNGIFKGFSFDYLELNVGILIENNIVQKGAFKRDYGKLF